MDPEAEDRLLSEGQIRFPNGNRARFIKSPSNASAGDLIRILQINKPRSLLLLIGGADELDQNLTSQLDQLFSRGLARAAADTEAVIMDGGTAAGVMELMGKAVADRGRVSPLVGVAPIGKVTYPGEPANVRGDDDRVPLDPNHSHFVLTEGSDWASGNEAMVKLASELGAGLTVIAVLVNGGPSTKDEVLRSVRQGWPIIVIEGSGRLADEIAGLTKKKPQIDDPVMAEIVSEGNFLLFPLSGTPADLRQFVVWRIEHHLVEAWRRFTSYDSKAVSEQRWFKRMLLFTLTLGVMGTLFALLETQLAGARNVPPSVMTALRYVVIGTPIIVSVLLTLSNRFKRDKKWILLRGSAEQIKKEIFRYRGRTGDYGDRNISALDRPASREQVFVQKMAAISQRLMTTEVSAASLPAKSWSIPPGNITPLDDGFSVLTPERYITVRLADQLGYYDSKTRTLDRQLGGLTAAILIVGGAGTFLAAAGYKLWIALTTAFVTALTAYVGQLQIERTLVKYNQTATGLSNLRAWWDTLPGDEKFKPDNRDMLIEMSEAILEAERTGWLRQVEESTEQSETPDESKKNSDSATLRPSVEKSNQTKTT
jgi:SLOG in TRPM, prokaryote/SMODS and SLOG-associating 2TM effector domain 1/Protein of unknown function (DUF4231)